MEFYRVLNWDPSATDASENGHPLFVWPDQGNGRVDDPTRDYLVLYVGSHPEAAVAEALGRFPIWKPAVLDVPRAAPAGSRKALVKYVGTPRLLDLDDPGVLLDLGLRPSQIVTREYAVTQQWSRTIFETNQHDGVSWWSFYGSQWASIGLWDWTSLSVEGDPEILTLDHPAVEAAAAEIVRTIPPR
ncbi:MULTISPECIES: RES family NAD+ phosphorylase [unclassified Arthrobacter]|uniref:RES family NAD+ phosphorylase n=1 Tax=unclassified Arthrobacter TaxID=235627 RepID=UPI001E3BEC2A|nr:MULTISPECIES: RES family NAD+ phosphorylase [unclassified Arthrobacter]MCC9145203.1 RES family NAD+ phosphorylase [Arthrobacter sp. zg-Y919]MDK1276431.1 RES family NAD+ phosphorylase [Arthrobacter sp. zg.Y919]WIB01969.1 RES family NAD+ phosphorylase [Arthrobacter sp. zg-Y919]